MSLKSPVIRERSYGGRGKFEIWMLHPVAPGKLPQLVPTHNLLEGFITSAIKRPKRSRQTGLFEAAALVVGLNHSRMWTQLTSEHPLMNIRLVFTKTAKCSCTVGLDGLILSNDSLLPTGRCMA
jgi:hypothetical protein